MQRSPLPFLFPFVRWAASAFDPEVALLDLIPFRASCSAIKRFFKTSEVSVAPVISAAPSMAEITIRYSLALAKDEVI